MKYNNIDECVNSPELYLHIANMLMLHGKVLIGWSDGRASHFDILFTIEPARVGPIQRGIRETDLFVSVIGHISYGFSIDPSIDILYIECKLRLQSIELATLVQGVIKELI